MRKGGQRGVNWLQTKWLQAFVGSGTSGSEAEREAAQRGQGMVEYALILVLVAVAVIAALTLLGHQIQSVFNNVTSTLGGGH
ncbi:MAG: Flp family type IVb pilin [Candidatus Dormibacteraeota bacterium]|nr:Flp family type IVb pilin [Candidatus Dormibacteraeota bacterium]MBO0708255.1 Flp family type IVb pilin [Candidatus Dormibacteraeota bacterium]